MRKASLILLLLTLPFFSWAENVTLAVSKSITANAEYFSAEPGKPAIILLHGFLQTGAFPTVNRLAVSLQEEGYTVLAPTLSLGITLRKQSMACDAIHAHTLQDDHREISLWIKWLRGKGFNKLILMGHSTGSMELLSYLHDNAVEGIEKFIGISIVEGQLELDPAAQQKLQKELRQRVAKGDRSLVKHTLSYCKPITATAKSMLSYVEWTPDKILDAVKKVQAPMVFIMGSKDERLGKNWIERLRAAGRPVHIIDGANHFMDGEHEFSLLDQVLAEMP